MLRCFAAALLFVLPVAAAATPITIQIDAGSPDSTTGYVGGTTANTPGHLSGDLDGDVLSGLHGEVFDHSFGQVAVLDGSVDFSGNADSWFTTDLWGSFDITSSLWNGSSLSLWATTSQCYGWGCKNYWWRLYGWVDHEYPDHDMIPEPSAALLFGLGAVIVSRRVRR